MNLKHGYRYQIFSSRLSPKIVGSKQCQINTRKMFDKAIRELRLDLLLMNILLWLYLTNEATQLEITGCYLTDSKQFQWFNCLWINDAISWWRPQIETFSALLALCAGNAPVTGEFPSQRPVTRGFDIFLDLRLNKRLSKQSRRRWFEKPSRSLWRYCNVVGEQSSGKNEVDEVTLCVW